MSSAPTSNTEWTSPLILRVSDPVYSSVPPDFETVKEWDVSSFLTSDTYYNNRLYFNNHSMNELDSLLVSIVSAGSQQSIGLQRNGWRKGRGKNAEKSWCVTCKYLQGARCTKRQNSERLKDNLIWTVHLGFLSDTIISMGSTSPYQNEKLGITYVIRKAHCIIVQTACHIGKCLQNNKIW